MRRTSYAGRFGVLVFAIIALIFPVSGQVSLRNALDFDGDGRADYYIWDTVNSNWSIRTNNTSFFVQRFGTYLADFPAPGDYDGDGKGDIGVFNDSTGTWSRIESSTGAIVTRSFGQPCDEPVARDYDGDGKTDLAVVHTSGGALTWNILRSTDGVQITLRPDCT